MSRIADLDLDLPSSVLRLLFESPTTTTRFESPWRCGANAAWGLCDYFTSRFNGVQTEPDKLVAIGQMSRLVYATFHIAPHSGVGGTEPKALYEDAAELGSKASFVRDRQVLFAFTRCVQLYVSHSDGGGYVYNELLQQVESSTDLNEEAFDSSMREARALDAIGSKTMLKNDAADPIRAAFLTLWQRKHYRAIYALPPVGR